MKRNRQEEVAEYYHVINELASNQIEACQTCLSRDNCDYCKSYDEYEAKVEDAKKIYKMPDDCKDRIGRTL